MSKHEPEIIDLTTTPQTPEIIVIESSDDDEVPANHARPGVAAPDPPAALVNRSTPTPRKKSLKSPPSKGEVQVGTAHDSGSSTNGRSNTSLEAAHTTNRPHSEAVNGKHVLDANSRSQSRRDKRRRREARSRETSPRGGGSSRSQDRRRRATTPQDGAGIFFVDVAPALVTRDDTQENYDTPPLEEGLEQSTKLLLPAHVSVLDTGVNSGKIPIKVITPPEIIEDYIEYLDYDDFKAAGVVRYFAMEQQEPQKHKLVCKNCGAAGEHKTIDCPIQICLTCGARDEHSTRGCPISKVCYTCGMKGHINRTCPNRYSSSFKDHHGGYDCQRCGSDLHNPLECPTLWRLYDYHTTKERDSILRARSSKKKLRLGNGGEAYIANDEWCYNCGQQGHWGDDCNVLSRTENAPNEPSAFGRYNATSGPFFVASPKLAPSSSAHGREPRDWEREDVIVDKSGYHAPAHVGKQGRKKDRAKMERRAREQELDDEEDWFGKTPSSRDRHSKEHSKSPSKKLTFGSSLRPSSRTFDSSAKPRSERSLRDRLSGEVDRPPPTEPRSWHRSNSLLKRIGDQKV